MRRSDFQRGIVAAAYVAAAYNSSSTHPYRLDDCILAKLNVSKRKPRRNRQVQRSDRDAWLVGCALALAEMHRRLAGAHASAVVAVAEGARTAGLTLASARAAGVSAFDLKELKKAGIR